MLLLEDGTNLQTETLNNLLTEDEEMAATYIECDHNFGAVRKGDSAIIKAREAREELRIAIRSMESLRDGDGSLASHYALLATEGGYAANGYADANAAAKAHYDELSSLYSKLSKPAGQGDETGAAIDQAAGKLGI